jgi:uronate dehydrogenase
MLDSQEAATGLAVEVSGWVGSAPLICSVLQTASKRFGSVLVMTQTRRRVVLTGAGGRIGRAITPLLPANWDVESTDLAASKGISALDISNPDACRAAFGGADAIVHLAAVPDPEASWERLLPANVVGVYQVAQAAVSCGVRRLVLASSLHAVSATSDQTQVRIGDPPRPGNLYGATKAWAEALGAWVAATTPTSVVALRMGYFSSQRPDAGTLSTQELSSSLASACAETLVVLPMASMRRRVRGCCVSLVGAS